MALTVRYVSPSGTALYAASILLATPMSFDTMVTSASAADDIRLLPGTYSRSGSDTFTNAGTATSPISISGADSSGNLLSNARTNGNGPLIGTNFPAITYAAGFLLTLKAFTIIDLSSISGNVSGALVTLAANDVVKSCIVANASTNAAAVGIVCNFSGIVIVDNDVSLTGASGGSAAISCTGGAPKVLCNRVNGGPAAGITTAVSAVIVDNTVFSSTGNHIATTAIASAPLIMNNTLVGGGADAISVFTGSQNIVCIINNICTDNVGAGVNMISTANAGYISNLRTRDNGSTISNGGDWVTATNYVPVTSGAGTSDFVNKAGGNFVLLATSPAVGAGLPLYSSIGALQSDGDSVDPGISNVLSGVAYAIQGATLTGTYVVVTTANVRSGTTFGAASASTGTLAVPSVGNVILGVAVDNTTGTYKVTATGDVRLGVTFGAAAAQTGTLAAGVPGNNIIGD